VGHEPVGAIEKLGRAGQGYQPGQRVICDGVAEVLKLTGGRWADSVIEALSTQATIDSGLCEVKLGDNMLSLGVYCGELTISLSAFAVGLGDRHLNTALYLGGKQHLRRLMNVLASGRFDPGVLVTHHDALEQIVAACDLFSHRPDGVLKVASSPDPEQPTDGLSLSPRFQGGWAVEARSRI